MRAGFPQEGPCPPRAPTQPGAPVGRALTPRGRTGHRPGPRSRCRSARTARTGRARTGCTPPSRPRPARTRSRLWTPPRTCLRRRNATGQAGQGTRSPRAPPRTTQGLQEHRALSPQRHWVVLGLQGERPPVTAPWTPTLWTQRCKGQLSPRYVRTLAFVPCVCHVTGSQRFLGPPRPRGGKDTVLLTSDTAESESHSALQTPGQLLPAQAGTGGAARTPGRPLLSEPIVRSRMTTPRPACRRVEGEAEPAHSRGSQGSSDPDAGPLLPAQVGEALGWAEPQVEGAAPATAVLRT